MNIDNNPVERAIRPFVTGRKNWLFSDTVAGANLRYILKELPTAQSIDDIDALLSCNLNADQINPDSVSPEEWG